MRFCVMDGFRHDVEILGDYGTHIPLSSVLTIKLRGCKHGSILRDLHSLPDAEYPSYQNPDRSSQEQMIFPSGIVTAASGSSRRSFLSRLLSSPAISFYRALSALARHCEDRRHVAFRRGQALSFIICASPKLPSGSCDMLSPCAPSPTMPQKTSKSRRPVSALAAGAEACKAYPLIVIERIAAFCWGRRTFRKCLTSDSSVKENTFVA